MKLNELPVKTCRWLNVNEYEFDIEPIYKDFNGKIEIKSDESILIKNTLDMHAQYFDNEDDGISKEVLNYINQNFNSGLFIHAKKKHENPIIIKYVLDDNNDLLIDKNIIFADENSNLTVLIQYEDDSKTAHYGLTKVIAKCNSNITIIKIQKLSDNSTHVDSVIGYAEDGANINFVQIEVGAKKSITNYLSKLNGFSSQSNINSAYFGDKDRYLDLSYNILHFGKKTKSNIDVKGALKDTAKKIFKGTLDFKKGCKMAKGSEEEYTILLDKNAKSDSVPLLLCSEDDVEGNHAASTGKIDENKLFYIMSRGFSEKEAKLLLIEASLKPIIDLIPNEDIKEDVWSSIEGRMFNV